MTSAATVTSTTTVTSAATVTSTAAPGPGQRGSAAADSARYHSTLYYTVTPSFKSGPLRERRAGPGPSSESSSCSVPQ